MKYRPLTNKELSDIQLAGSYTNWAIQERRKEIKPSIIRLIQLCYESGIRDRETIKKETIRILRLPKCHQKEDAELIDWLIPEVIDDFKVRKNLLQIPLVDPFTKQLSW